MLKINHTHLNIHTLKAIYSAAKLAQKTKVPQVLKNAKGAPWLVVRYNPIFKRARFEVTSLYGKPLKKEIDKAFFKVLQLEKPSELGAGFKQFFNKSMV